MQIRKIFVNGIVYPLMERIKGNKIRAYYKELKLTEKYDRAQIEALQREKLKNLLLYCIKNVPAYMHLAYLEPMIKEDPLEALKSFPVLTKKDFSKEPEKYLSLNVDKSSLIHYTTGGSTGLPVKFYVDRPTLEHYAAARLRGLSWWGIEIGDPCVMIWASPIELNRYQNKLYRLKERLLRNIILFSAYDLQPAKIADLVKIVDSYKPVYFYGYASALYVFANLMEKQNLTFATRFKGVVSTAETLSDEQRKVIERAFGAPVINEYGAKDGGIIAYQCPDGNMHVTEENLVLEVLDIKTNARVEDGQSGLATITDLTNYSMPRIRYQLGDVITLSNKKGCPCGRQLKILERIEGREDDVFVSQSGRLIHGIYWAHIVRNMNGIQQFQLIQHDLNNVTLRIVPNPSLFDPKEVNNLVKRIYEALGNVNVQIEYCDEIKPSASGKIRYSIRNFPLNL
ncbi:MULTISPECIES: phenylacetate--CoA ligase family protein [unclassified Caldisericum]|jgi:phenylacetate-CoA ligase|uniref:phenylacetate--CoA ligase family protein n=1 Tax=unclassified Caldisericum TaxID=2641600 RepID=UPI0039FBCD8E